jgi:outer membrane protein OmpA-like peptidoglycan-associated protein
MLTELFLVLSLFVVISISAFEIITKEDIQKNIVEKEAFIKKADFLKSNSETNVVMAGFTDNVGTEAYNLPLSKRRVESVANYMEQQGVGADRMALLWYGQTNPIADNSTPEGRAKNRRVEIAVGGM